jgi:hypothetical protein
MATKLKYEKETKKDVGWYLHLFLDLNKVFVYFV